MSDRPPSPSLAATVAGYQSRVTLVAPDGKAVQQVAPADPQRWMIRIYKRTGGATVDVCVPDSEALVGLVLGEVPAPIESKFRDAPDWTQGAWYGQGTSPAGWIVVESLYVR